MLKLLLWVALLFVSPLLAIAVAIIALLYYMMRGSF
jgi:hypothetical protein